jgi:hypothetical protein
VQWCNQLSGDDLVVIAVWLRLPVALVGFPNFQFFRCVYL